jgi:hypothetical protein
LLYSWGRLLIGALSARLRGGRADIEYSTVDVR